MNRAQIGEKLEIPSLFKTGSSRDVGSIEEFEAWRERVSSLIFEHKFGKIPPTPEHLITETLAEDNAFCAGHALLKKMKLIVTVEGKRISFPFAEMKPYASGKLPAFVHINFSPDVPDKYMPSEEMCDRGFAVFSFSYTDVTSDDGDFSSGVASQLLSGKRTLDSAGKIAIWAWAAMCIMDYIEGLSYIDKERVAVIGHSRLGLAALLAGAFDWRFKYVIANCPCVGADVLNESSAEQRHGAPNDFSHCFCKRYDTYAIGRKEFPFERQHLLALTVPRHLLIGTAELDLWADPTDEFLSLACINEAYSLYGMRGLVFGEVPPKAPTVLSDGDAHYHIRRGTHYLSREDWNIYMNFIEKI